LQPKYKGEIVMATYLMFGQYSHESVKGISPKRTEKAAELVKKNGGEVKAGYVLLGDTDLALIVELPGNDAAVKTSVELSKMLGISFTTAPAMTVEAFDGLMGG
jgi:uncharacterized protein with GYD domain